jgi:hypothetical protein
LLFLLVGLEAARLIKKFWIRKTHAEVSAER